MEVHGGEQGSCGLGRSPLGGTSATPGLLLASMWATGRCTGHRAEEGQTKLGKWTPPHLVFTTSAW